MQASEKLALAKKEAELQAQRMAKKALVEESETAAAAAGIRTKRVGKSASIKRKSKLYLSALHLFDYCNGV